MKRKNKMQKHWAIAIPLALFALLAVPTYAEWSGAWVITTEGRVSYWHKSHGVNPLFEACGISGRDSGYESGKIWLVDYVRGAGCLDGTEELFDRLLYENVPYEQINPTDLVVYSTTDYFACINFNCRYGHISEKNADGVVVTDYGNGLEAGRFIPKEQIFGVAIGVE